MEKNSTWEFYQRLEELLWEFLDLYADTVGGLDDPTKRSDTHRVPDQDVYAKKVLGIKKRLSLLQMDAGKGKKGEIPLLRLYRLFQPGEFAWFCALLSLAAEWNGEFCRRLGKLQGNYGPAFPTVGFCASCFTQDPAEQNASCWSWKRGLSFWMLSLKIGTEAGKLILSVPCGFVQEWCS